MKRIEAVFKLDKTTLNELKARAGARAVDLGGSSVYQGGQSVKLSTKPLFSKE